MRECAVLGLDVYFLGFPLPHSYAKLLTNQNTMPKLTTDLWINAWHDAAMIMGRENANKDPMAWWCLVELLVSYAYGNKGK